MVAHRGREGEAHAHPLDVLLDRLLLAAQTVLEQLAALMDEKKCESVEVY